MRLSLASLTAGVQAFCQPGAPTLGFVTKAGIPGPSTLGLRGDRYILFPEGREAETPVEPGPGSARPWPLGHCSWLVLWSFW